MSPSFKIRLLWFLLTLSFIATSLTIRLTFHEENILRNDAKTLESNLHKKEQYIQEFLNNVAQFEALKTVEKNGILAAHLYNELRTKRSVYLFTYRNNQLVYWNSSRITYETDLWIKEGSSLVSLQNGSYEAIKKTSGDFSVVCFIPIKAEYPYTNKYLLSTFDPNLISSDNLEIADFNDLQVINIRSSINSNYLFAVKLKPQPLSGFYDPAEIFMWLASCLSGCIFMHYLYTWIAMSGRIKTAIIILPAMLLLIRMLSLHYNWLGSNFDFEVFNPKHYAGNYFNPSIGDFLLNVLLVSWCLVFAYNYRNSIRLTDKRIKPWLSRVLFVLLVLFVSVVAYYINESLYSLVVNSSIRLDLINLLNLNNFGWLGILIICVSILNLYLLIEVLVTISQTLRISIQSKAIVFFSCTLVLTIIDIVLKGSQGFFLLFALIVFLRGWVIYKLDNEFNLGVFVFTALLFATIVSIKLTKYQYIKDVENRKILATNLEMPDDQNAVLRFASIEGRIAMDETITHYFKDKYPDYSELKNKLQKFYFDGYLGRYGFTTYGYDVKGNSLDNYGVKTIEEFKELVLSGSIKISEYFYRVNNTFGNRHYFAIIPIVENFTELGTLIIDLESNTFQNPDAFPPVLFDGLADESEILRNYSFAFYKDGILINQYGEYTYPLINNEFRKQTGEFSTSQDKGYDHLMYKPKSRNVVVVSSAIPGFVPRLGAISFLFLVIIAFSLFCVFVKWLWNKLGSLERIWSLAMWKRLLSVRNALYKTRIQASIVTAVVITLIFVGASTYLSINQQYSEQQLKTLKERIDKVTTAFENQILKNDIDLTGSVFNGFADLNSVDLNYYNTAGKLVYSTQPKIYESNLISVYINALAYTNLNIFRSSEFINTTEQIGRLHYIAAYKPVRNSKHKTIGYLGLPYFSNERDFDTRIGQFLNTLVNVYALVLVAIGFFAVFMANQITYPLTLIQKSLRQTKIDRKNEPILWKRNDEIGNLIREYNTMIEALEESANRLARSERETAWKEMAKQVAHEIKNPLTPLKLGVQLLNKSWKEQDPGFPVKFEKFSKSFIEQIESLAHIASEFSNFAKMPETSLENVRLREVIDRSIEVYNKVDNVSIILEDKFGHESLVKGDRDQLMRCFNNLLKNAIEAIPDQRKGVIRICVGQRNGRSVIELSDNGKGIPDDLRDRIFNPNFTTKSSGTGLGLAFVKQAIENMGGRITLETEVNKGTTFYITLPLA